MGYNMKHGNSAVPFKELGSSPAKTSKTRKSSETQYNPDGTVDSTPVGHEKGTKSAGYGWGAASKHGNERASMVKGLRDRAATEKEHQKIKDQAQGAESVNLGGMTPTMG